MGDQPCAHGKNGVGYADSVQEFSASGAALSGSAGFTGGGLSTPRSLAIDAYGNVWAGGADEISEFNSQGVPLSGSSYVSSSLPPVEFKMSFDRRGIDWLVGFSSSTGAARLTEFTPATHAESERHVWWNLR